MADSGSRFQLQVGWRPVVFAILASLLGVRIVLQAMRAQPTTGLGEISAWFAGALPWPVLLALQVIVLCASLWVLWAMWTGRPSPQPKLGRVLVWIGWIYLVGATFRFVIGLTANESVFNGAQPGLSHMLLAGMVLLFAAHISDEARRRASDT